MISNVSKSQPLDILAPRPQIRQPPYTVFTPVSPRRNTVSFTSFNSNRNNVNEWYGSAATSSSDAALHTIRQLPDPRLPEVPILVLNNSSSSKISSKTSNMTQGLLPAFIPAPYELGPNGLTLIMPRRVISTSGAPSVNNRYLGSSSLLSSNSRFATAK